MHVAVLAMGLVAGLTGTVVGFQQVDEPTLELDPIEVESGGTVAAKGAHFQPGSIGIHLGSVQVGGEVATAAIPAGADGTFEVDVPIGAQQPGPLEVITCRDISRTGVCREEARARVLVLRPPTSTLGTTTTTKPPTATTTNPPSSPTTVARPTTTAVFVTVPATQPQVVANPTTTSAPTFTTSTTSVPGLAIATTTTSTTIVGGLVSNDDGLGPDPTFDPTPQDLLGPTTTLAPEYAADHIDHDYDIELTHIEVTQGLQNLDNEFPLLADRPTAVRVYGLHKAGPNGVASAFLEVSRNGEVLDILEAENNPVEFPDSFVRSSNDATPYFLLDDAYLEDELTLRALAIIGDPTLSNDLNPADNFIQTTVELHPSLSVKVHAFPLYLADDGTSGGDNLLIHDADEGWIQQALAFYRLWPIAYSTFDPYNPTVGNAGSGWDMSTEDSGSEPFASLAAVHATNGYGAREVTMGMVHEDANVYWGGFAQSPGSVSWSRMRNGYSAEWPWHQRAGGTLAQEIGHNFGLQHVPCASSAFDPLPGELHGGPIDPLFPQAYSWPHCSIAPLDPEGFYGFDVLWSITDSDEPSIMTNNPGSQPPFNAAPFMSYKGIGKWLEPWHGCALLNAIDVPCTQTDLIPIDDDTPGQGQGLPPIGHGVPVFNCDDMSPFEEEGDLCDFTFDQPFEPSELDDTDHELFVFATVDAEAGTAEIRPGQHLDPDQYDPASRLPDGDPDELTQTDAPWALWDYGGDGIVDAQDYVVWQRNAAGEVIGLQTLDVLSANGQRGEPLAGDHPGESSEDGNPLLEEHSHGVAELLVRLPALPGTASIQITNDSGVIAELAPGASPPVIESFVVAANEERARFTFSATDPDGDSVHTLIQYRTDGPWMVVAEPSNDGAPAEIDLAMLPGGRQGEFRLAASDGINQTIAISEPVTLPDRAPFAAVVTPTTDHERPEGRIVQLRGTAIDLEHRDDPDAVTTSWASDLDGPLGDGTVLTTRALSYGTHTITFTATDPEGMTSTDSVIVHIGPTDLAPDHVAAAVAERFRLGPPDAATAGSAGDGGDADGSGGDGSDDDGDSSTWWILIGIGAVALIVAAVVGGFALGRRRDDAKSPTDVEGVAPVDHDQPN